MKFLVVAGFGIAGVLSRLLIYMSAEKHTFAVFPYPTFLINILGSFLIGIIYVLGTEKGAISPELRLGLSVGLLGGFTTFSAYSLEAVGLFEKGQILTALTYILLSPLTGIGAAFLGMFLTRHWIST